MSFIIRTSLPESGNKYYNRKATGGYNPCIAGSPTRAGLNVLANCVGWAVGRFNEIGGYKACKYLGSRNAENFIELAKSQGLEISQSPSPGAVMCWQKGATLSGSDGAGHVCIVEQVIDATTVKTSESGYGASKPFWSQTRRKGADGRWGESSAYTFRGFIVNPAPCCKSDTTPNTPVTNKVVATGIAYFFDKALAGTYTVTASSGLNVRNAAGTSRKVLVTIPQGTKVDCYGYYSNSAGVKWLYVQFTYKGTQYTGFASNQYLKK